MSGLGMVDNVQYIHDRDGAAAEHEDGRGGDGGVAGRRNKQGDRGSEQGGHHVPRAVPAQTEQGRAWAHSSTHPLYRTAVHRVGQFDRGERGRAEAGQAGREREQAGRGRGCDAGARYVPGTGRPPHLPCPVHLVPQLGEAAVSREAQQSGGRGWGGDRKRGRVTHQLSHPLHPTRLLQHRPAPPHVRAGGVGQVGLGWLGRLGPAQQLLGRGVRGRGGQDDGGGGGHQLSRPEAAVPVPVSPGRQGGVRQPDPLPLRWTDRARIW